MIDLVTGTSLGGGLRRLNHRSQSVD